MVVLRDFVGDFSSLFLLSQFCVVASTMEGVMFKYYVMTVDDMAFTGDSLSECRAKAAGRGYDKDPFQFWGIPQGCWCRWVGSGWQWDFEEPQLLHV